MLMWTSAWWFWSILTKSTSWCPFANFFLVNLENHISYLVSPKAIKIFQVSIERLSSEIPDMNTLNLMFDCWLVISSHIIRLHPIWYFHDIPAFYKSPLFPIISHSKIIIIPMIFSQKIPLISHEIPLYKNHWFNSSKIPWLSWLLNRYIVISPLHVDCCLVISVVYPIVSHHLTWYWAPMAPGVASGHVDERGGRGHHRRRLRFGAWGAAEAERGMVSGIWDMGNNEKNVDHWWFLWTLPSLVLFFKNMFWNMK